MNFSLDKLKKIGQFDCECYNVVWDWRYIILYRCMGKVIFFFKLQLFSDINLFLFYVENYREMILMVNLLFFMW